ncbi:MAG: hypothetical protein IPM18_13110 [Phycisphaerales bacterium]|nr:hypothetical protein [Phycisphaerales bacterium]
MKPSCLVVLAVGSLMLLGAMSAHATVDYDPGWFWDSYKVRNGPASTGYKVQLCYRCRSWRTVSSGTTNSSGNASGRIIRWGPGHGKQPGHLRVRVVFNNGGTQGGRFVGLTGTGNQHVTASVSDHMVGLPGVSGAQLIVVSQNSASLVVETGETAWFLDGSAVTLRLPEHFVFAEPPIAMPTVPGDLILGPALLIEGGRAVQVPVFANARAEPTSGIAFLNVWIAYDGLTPADYYWPSVTALAARTPSGSPFDTLEQGEVRGHFRGIRVQAPQPAAWFDETGGGLWSTFGELQNGFAAWLGSPDREIGFEEFPPGTKITDEYDPQGVWFSGAEGGNYDELTGVRPEGDPNLVQNLTGYDGSYQPDGSHVYIRFQNTLANPAAPVTFTFDSLQRRVGGFMACGVEGPEHSFTVTAYDVYGEPLAQRLQVAQVWEPDPTGQNAETFFGVEAPYPCIQRVTISNNALLPFADTLIFDNLAWAAWPTRALGDRDLDGDIDGDDFLLFAECLTGPDAPQAGLAMTDECQEAFEAVGDFDIDLEDFAVLQQACTGVL